MSRLLSLLLLIGFCNTAFSQDVRLGLYPISTEMGQMAGFQREALHTKLRGWLASKGYVAADINAPIGVLPTFSFGEARTVDAGMKKMTVVDAELVLTLQQRKGNPTFASFSKKFTASGTDANSAKRELLNQIPIKDAGFEAFLKENLPKVTAFYAEHCKDLLAEAEALGTRQEYEQALGLLVNIPTNLPCHQDTKALVKSFYEKKRDLICEFTLLRAQSAAAKKDYDGAVRALQDIDPEAKCFGEAVKYVEELKASVDADYKAELDTIKAYYEAKAKVSDEQRVIIVQDHLMKRHF